MLEKHARTRDAKKMNAIKRMEECKKCYQAYSQTGLQNIPAMCSLGYELMSFRITGRDGICGQLEIILRDMEKHEQGRTNLTYPQIKEWKKEEK